MFGIFATINIKPDQRDSFLAVIRETAERSVKDEPGCLRFDVFQDLTNETRYILYEVLHGPGSISETFDDLARPICDGEVGRLGRKGI